MARTSTYLNFMGKTEEAFRFYAAVFKTALAEPIARMGDVPGCSEQGVREDEKHLVMHVALPILGGHVLMGTDALESRGHALTFGTNVSINLEPDTRAEADRLFRELGEGGTVMVPLQEMFWGGYFGTLTDRFGVQWMVNSSGPQG